MSIIVGHMSLSRTSARFVFLGAALVVCAVSIFFVSSGFGRERKLRVVFFAVGQGDSIFIESPSGTQVLVDGGPDSSVLRGLSHELGFFDRSIDMVLATHEDKDHVGGLPEVFRRYRVGMLVRTENQGESTAAHLIDTLPTLQGSHTVYARRGQKFDLGDGVALTILFPDRDPTGWESNTSSIVARLTYGDLEFLLTGDSPQGIEKYLVGLDSTVLSSDVLKLGHHGSRTSSSHEFLSAVHPTYAIVSAGKHNRYGHPHKEAIDSAQAEGATVLNTATEGSIAFETDGVTLERATGWWR